jgi:tripeptide aminopeptidase
VVDSLPDEARLNEWQSDGFGHHAAVEHYISALPRIPSSRTDVLDLFLALVSIPSPPGAERAVADVVSGYLRDLALTVDEDDAGSRIGGNAGNLLCRIPPTGDGRGTPIFLCAHLDTVPPEGPIEPVIEDGVVRNAGGTILGADNKAAVAAMLQAVRLIVAEGRPHAGVELLFTPKEEVGLQGAHAFDHTRLVAPLGYVYDQGAPIGEVVLGAPTQTTLWVRFHGRAAHAGMVPEEGRSAIAAAARAIAELRLGRLDDETTANVGLVSGGTARNVVPEWCSFEAEARSHDPRKLADLVQEMIDSFTFAAGAAECELETRLEEAYRGYRFHRDDLPVQVAATALGRSGFVPRYVLTGGGADANVFNARGLPCVNLANGMTDIHTAQERIAVEDLERMVGVTLELVDAARDADRP